MRVEDALDGAARILVVTPSHAFADTLDVVAPNVSADKADALLVDNDGDGVADNTDNCPNAANSPAGEFRR